TPRTWSRRRSSGPIGPSTGSPRAPTSGPGSTPSSIASGPTPSGAPRAPRAPWSSWVTVRRCRRPRTRWPAAARTWSGPCPACRAQVESERALRQRLHALAPLEPRSALPAEVRRRLRPESTRLSRVLLAAAAGLALAFLWGRGSAPFVAWELARDHDHCFSFPVLRAQVWSDDPARVAEWFARQGTQIPAIPAAAAGLELVGARYCPLIDRRVGHVYYVGGGRHLSVYAVPGSGRFSPE